MYLLQPSYKLHNMKERNGSALSTEVTSRKTCRKSAECHGKFFSFDINRREFETSFGCQSYDIIEPWCRWEDNVLHILEVRMLSNVKLQYLHYVSPNSRKICGYTTGLCPIYRVSSFKLWRCKITTQGIPAVLIIMSLGLHDINYQWRYVWRCGVRGYPHITMTNLL